MENFKNVVKRLTNYGSLMAIISQVILVMQLSGVGINFGQFKAEAVAVLGLLSLLGIINNPTTDNKGYLDDVTIAPVETPAPIEIAPPTDTTK